MEQATRDLLQTYFLNYSLTAGLTVTASIVVLASLGLDVTLKSILFFTALASAGLVLVPFAVSDSGLESAGAGVQGGFDVTNPSTYRAGSSTDGSTRLKAVFVIAGTGLYAITGFLVL